MFLAILSVIIGLLLISFGFVLFFGAPFLPTLKLQINEALDMLDLKPGQTLLDLGCGDGRVLKAAADRGLLAVGYELNPVLVIVARLRTRRYRAKVKVLWGNYWHETWPPAEGIFGFILPKYMAKLHKIVIQYPHKPVKLASFAFSIPNTKPSRVSKGIYLYKY
jgi:SAM-dependent methyltransferase